MLIITFLIAIALLIVAFIIFAKKDNKDLALKFVLGGGVGIFFSVFLLIVTAIVGISNMRTFEIKDYTKDDISYEFIFMNDEHYYVKPAIYTSDETNLAEGFYVDFHLITPFEKLMYFPLLEKDTGYIINNVYVVRNYAEN